MHGAVLFVTALRRSVSSHGHPERNEVESKDLPYRLWNCPQYRWEDSSGQAPQNDRNSRVSLCTMGRFFAFAQNDGNSVGRSFGVFHPPQDDRILKVHTSGAITHASGCHPEPSAKDLLPRWQSHSQCVHGAVLFVTSLTRSVTLHRHPERNEVESKDLLPQQEGRVPGVRTQNRLRFSVDLWRIIFYNGEK